MPPETNLPSGTVTFLFTDIEGSIRLNMLGGDRCHDLLDPYNRVLRAAFAEHDSGRMRPHTSEDSFYGGGYAGA
jgi:hypothetical protein